MQRRGFRAGFGHAAERFRHCALVYTLALTFHPQEAHRMATKYDAIIIGTGQAAPSLAARLAGAGWRVAVAERKRFGGTCVNTGCIPTKTLVASARAAYVARRAADYGVMIGGESKIDMQRG